MDIIIILSEDAEAQGTHFPRIVVPAVPYITQLSLEFLIFYSAPLSQTFPTVLLFMTPQGIHKHPANGMTSHIVNTWTELTRELLYPDSLFIIISVRCGIICVCR